MSKVELWVVLLYYISPEGAKQGQIIYLEIWILLTTKKKIIDHTE